MISVEGFNAMGAETGHQTEGIRHRILSRLRATGEITDPSGLASGTLLKAVGYRGSSAAFAQLLSAMERDGLIEREIRGKRTYRIGPADGEARPHRGEARGGSTVPATNAAPATDEALDPNPETSTDTAPERGARDFEPRASASADLHDTAGFDYETLAVRLLAQVVRRIAAAPDESFPPDGAMPAARALPGNESRGDDLALTLISLERRLASIQSRQRELSEETAMLRAQLAAAQRRVAEIQAGFAGGQLKPEERQVLQRLLSSLDAPPVRRQSAEAG
jgi:hypothetical protein